MMSRVHESHVPQVGAPRLKSTPARRNFGPASTTRQLARATHCFLPGTANRVETYLTHRKQSTAYLSTRHSSRDANFREIFYSIARRACGAKYWLLASTSHESPVTNHTPLIGTRERLESPLSHRKQSTGYRSNRYSSHPAFRTGSFAPESLASRCRACRVSRTRCLPATRAADAIIKTLVAPQRVPLARLSDRRNWA
jgi:hypothetical protein